MLNIDKKAIEDIVAGESPSQVLVIWNDIAFPQCVLTNRALRTAVSSWAHDFVFEVSKFYSSLLVAP
jgi:hypothetical protein